MVSRPFLRLVVALYRMAAADGAHPRDPRRARDYNREKERLLLVGVLASSIGGALVVFSGLGARLRSAVQSRAGRGLAGRGAVIALFGVLAWLVGIPLGYYSGYVVEHRYGLSNQSRLAWLVDQLKGLGLSLAFEIPIASGLYAVIRRRPRSWWAIVSAISLPVTVLMAQLYPVLIAPIFNKYEPLRDRALAERLKRIAAESGIEVADVMQMDMSRQTKKANAFFTGIGRTKRIVLADTLLDNFTPEEIEVIIAHEIAHQAHRDIWRFVALGTAFTFATSYVTARGADWFVARFGKRIGTRRLADVATLPLLGWIVSLVGLALTPIQNAYSRAIERRADEFALRLTSAPLDFGSAMTRLAEVNLSDPAPPAVVHYLLYSHPPVAERIAHAQHFAREHALPVPESLEVE